MTWRGVPPSLRGPLRRPWLWLAALLALGAAMALVRPATSWRAGADEGFYLRYATYIAAEGPRGFPGLFHGFLADPVAPRLFPSPARIAPIAYDALAVRLGGSSFETLARASLFAFLALAVVVFVATRPVLGDLGAVVTTLLVLTSPLGLGMARRALADCLNAFLLTAALALVIRGVAGRRGLRWWSLTSVACTLAFLCKELNLVLVPIAFSFVAIDAIRHRRRPAVAAVLCVSIVPMVLAGIVLAAAAGGAGTAWDTFVAAAAQSRTNEYLLQYAVGPWYRYFVDHLMLSPWTTLGYVVWLGYALGTRLDDDQLRAWTLVPVLFLLCMMPFTKLVRWALFLDVPMRLGVAALLLAHGGSRPRLVIALGTLALVVTQLAAFHRFFVVADVYDPTSVELMALTGFLPSR